MKLFFLYSVFIFGFVFGSFFNVLIYRLPKNESLWGRSKCPVCGHQLAWYDNIPIVSYLVLKGRCRYCGSPISPRYPAVELITATLWAVSYQLFGFSPLFFFAITLSSASLIVFFTDLTTHTVSDYIVFPALAVEVISAYFVGKQFFVETLISGGAAFILFFILYIVSKGGLADGDVTYGTLMGMSLGIFNFGLGLFIASILAIIFALVMKRSKTFNESGQLGAPFCVFMSVVTVVLFFIFK